LIVDVLLRRIIPHPAARSVIHTLSIVACFAYGHVAQSLKAYGAMDRHVAPGWCVLFVVLAAVAFRARRKRAATVAAGYLRAVGVALLVLQLFNAVGLLRANWNVQAEAAFEVAHLASENLDVEKPDIYYLILDGYAREDVFREFFEFDNSEFLAALRRRGFYVADDARSNYAQTRLSLSSSMNMDYLPEFTEGDRYDTHHPQLRRLRKNGAAVGRLRRLGYWYRYVGSRHYPSNNAADEQLFHGATNGDFVLSFIATTALDLARDAVRLSDWFTDDVDFHEFQFAHIPSHRGDAGPSFTFAHICCPHHPYVYDRHGPLAVPVHREVAQPRDYLEQLRYLNTKVLALVDDIDRASDGRAVILLQADHGSDFLGMPEDPTPEQWKERMSIFSAYKVPPQVKEKLYPSITPVNSFRVVLSGLFGDRLPTLEDRSYYSSYDTPFHLVECPQAAARD
jgi:hypothetical protein